MPGIVIHRESEDCSGGTDMGEKRTDGSAVLQLQTQAITAVRGRRTRKFSRDRPGRGLRCGEWTALTAYLRKFR